MAYSKTILCLAASWKHHGTCIAGKEYENGEFGDWIRPISSRDGEEISQAERRKDNGFPTNVLDVVTISFDQPKPHLHQQENQVIEENKTWIHRKMLSAAQAKKALDTNISSLWSNGHNSKRGQNDRVPEVYLDQFDSSLALIEPSNFVLHVTDESNDEDVQRKYRASFSFAGTDYNLSVTDPWVSRKLKDKKAGGYRADGAIICVSLGEVIDGYAYKLVASIIIKGRKG